MHEGRVPVGLGHCAVEGPLHGGVRVEVDGAGGGDAHQVGAETLEQAAGSFGGDDVPGTFKCDCVSILYIIFHYTSKSQ